MFSETKRQTQHTTKGAIYSIPCKNCEKGRTKRQIGTQLKEHKKVLSAKKITTSALVEHIFKTNHKIRNQITKQISDNGITSSMRDFQRVCLEA